VGGAGGTRGRRGGGESGGATRHGPIAAPSPGASRPARRREIRTDRSGGVGAASASEQANLATAAFEPRGRAGSVRIEGPRSGAGAGGELRGRRRQSGSRRRAACVGESSPQQVEDAVGVGGREPCGEVDGPRPRPRQRRIEDRRPTRGRRGEVPGGGMGSFRRAGPEPLEHRQHLEAQAAAGPGGIPVAGIVAPADAGGTTGPLELVPRHREQRPHQADAPVSREWSAGRHPREAATTAAPPERHEHRFQLIVRVVAGEHRRAAGLPRRCRQRGLAKASGTVQEVSAPGAGIDVTHGHRHAESRGERDRGVAIVVGVDPPQLVVDVDRQPGPRRRIASIGERSEGEEQGGRIRSAGDRDRDRLAGADARLAQPAVEGGHEAIAAERGRAGNGAGGRRAEDRRSVGRHADMVRTTSSDPRAVASSVRRDAGADEAGGAGTSVVRAWCPVPAGVRARMPSVACRPDRDDRPCPSGRRAGVSSAWSARGGLLAAAPGSAPESSGGIADAMPQLFLVGGVVALGVFLTLSIRARVERRRAAMVPADERIRAIKERARSRATSDAVEVGLVETAQRLAAQLDARAIRLERLIAEADRRLAAVGVAPSPPGAAPGAAAEAAAMTGPRPEPESPPAATAPPVAGSPAAGSLAPGPPAPGRVASSIPGPPAAAAVPTPSADGGGANPGGSLDPLVRSVHELADAGLAPIEIAHRLDEQVGKVDLILALRARR